jgi:hypothetical protein
MPPLHGTKHVHVLCNLYNVMLLCTTGSFSYQISFLFWENQISYFKCGTVNISLMNLLNNFKVIPETLEPSLQLAAAVLAQVSSYVFYCHPLCLWTMYGLWCICLISGKTSNVRDSGNHQWVQESSSVRAYRGVSLCHHSVAC